MNQLADTIKPLDIVVQGIACLKMGLAIQEDEHINVQLNLSDTPRRECLAWYLTEPPKTVGEDFDRIQQMEPLDDEEYRDEIIPPLYQHDGEPICIHDKELETYPKIRKIVSIFDLLGVYNPNNHKITLYLQNIMNCSQRLASRFENTSTIATTHASQKLIHAIANKLAYIVLIHESIHWMSHRGLDERGEHWQSGLYQQAGSALHETIAQVYTSKIIHQNIACQPISINWYNGPSLAGVFDELLKRQPYIYKLFKVVKVREYHTLRDEWHLPCRRYGWNSKLGKAIHPYVIPLRKRKKTHPICEHCHVRIATTTRTDTWSNKKVLMCEECARSVMF